MSTATYNETLKLNDKGELTCATCNQVLAEGAYQVYDLTGQGILSIDGKGILTVGPEHNHDEGLGN